MSDELYSRYPASRFMQLMKGKGYLVEAKGGATLVCLPPNGGLPVPLPVPDRTAIFYGSKKVLVQRPNIDTCIEISAVPGSSFSLNLNRSERGSMIKSMCFGA